MTTSTEQSNFTRSESIFIDPHKTAEIKRYKSAKTGLTVVHADIEGPLVYGHLVVPTKAMSDNGLPHTLEHLVFLGSERYPNKGTLDAIATRVYSSGTNAYTDTDRTVYTVTTAGSEGFLQLLPVYIDHILYPTLTDEGIYAEVHHINEKGENAGKVVYCEIMGKENLSMEIMRRRKQQLVYPKNSGYENESGGLMAHLRNLDIESIRQYHSEFYRSDNLLIVINGKIDQTDLLSTLENIDQSILNNNTQSTVTQQKKSFKKPWIPAPQVPDLLESHTEIIYFPGDESKDKAEVTVTWHGPTWSESLRIQAIYMLLNYLCGTASSPLRKEFVERDDQYCSGIYFSTDERSRVSTTLNFENVPMNKTQKLVEKLIETLLKITNTKDFDMDRMVVLIKKEKLKYLDNEQMNITQLITLASVTAYIYGDIDSKEYTDSLKSITLLDEIEKFKKEDWLCILKEMYIDSSYVAIIGEPSKSLSDQLQEQEKARLEYQRASLDEKSLQKLGDMLKYADSINNTKIPYQTLNSFSIPKTSHISSIDTLTAFNPYHVDDKTFPLPSKSLPNNLVQTCINKDGNMDDIPYYIQYDQTSSAFVTISVYMDTSNIPSHLKPYGRMYMDIIFESPILDGNNYIKHDDVIQKLDLDIASYDASMGHQDIFCEYIVIKVKVEKAKYKKGIDWLRHIMWNVQFTGERLKVAANKTLEDIPDAKKRGHLVADWTLRAMHTDINKSAEATCRYLYQDHFLPHVVDTLEKDPQQVIDDLNVYRSILCHGENFRVHVMGNITSLQNPKSAFRSWEVYEKNMAAAQKYQQYQHKLLPPAIKVRGVLGRFGKTPGHCAYIVESPFSGESSYSVHSTKGPSDIDSDDMPSLMVLMEILNAIEGHYNRLIRGQGLAYHCHLFYLRECGLIKMHIYNSSDISATFQHLRKATEKLSNGELAFNAYELEGAKSSVIYNFVQLEKTSETAAVQSFLDKTMRQRKRQNHELLKILEDVTMENVVQTLSKYLVPLFGWEKSNHVVVIHPTKSQQVAESLFPGNSKVEIIQLEDVYAKNIFQ